MTAGLVISAPSSGTGKTTVTLGVLRALARAGQNVQPFKCGPDYIDPAFHSAAAGRASVNLDSWAMPPALLDTLSSAPADIAIAEGAMGLFDGVARKGASGHGASADIAARFGWPVVLVLDASGQAQSVGAVARGFASHRPDVRVAGVILNRVASPRHEAMLRAGLDEAGVPMLGALPRRSDLALPERHLGLVQAQEHGALDNMLDALADMVEQHVDLGALRAAAQGQAGMGTAHAAPPPGQRIALARDAAFSFTYPHLLSAWREQGAEIIPFSPLSDEPPAHDADCCWLPGGYPELHAPHIAAAQNFLSGLRGFAQTHPVHGECGGYMVLGETLTDAEGTAHQMAGLLGLRTSFAKRKMHLGYRTAELVAPMPGLAAGTHARGHEFHYATIIDQPDAPLARVTDATGAEMPETGSHRGHVSGSFFHLIAEAP